MKTHVKATLAISVAMLGLVSQSQAATALLTSGTTISNGHTGPLGTTFTAPVSGTAVINRLGFYDAGGDGLTVGHDVGLYLWNGSDYILQVKATIPAGTAATLDGGFRWVDVADFTLSNTGGQSYAVFASTTASDGDSWGETAPSATGVGTAVQGWWGSGSIGALGSAVALGGIGGTANVSVYNIANIGYVPEPSAALLGGLGLLALLRRRRA